MKFVPSLLLLSLTTLSQSLAALDFRDEIEPFFEKNCYECHDDLSEKGGLDLYSLETDLSDEATFAKWVQIYDRVATGEMPPKEKDRPEAKDLKTFRKHLSPPLASAHEESKGTVFRRLNRNEYENTINDLLGVNLDLAETFPEDGRSHGFDTVGEALSISPVQMQSYLDAARLAIDACIVNEITMPKSETITATYAETRGAEKFLGDHWLLAEDRAVVFFRELGYPTGMLREATATVRGTYKIRVTGYAYQSEEPVTLSVGATSFARGSTKPIFGYYKVPPGEPITIELTTLLDAGYMIQIEPKGLYDTQNEIRENGIDTYDGPGLAITKVEVEGPILEEYPSRGHRLIFDGMGRHEIMPNHLGHREKSWYRPKFAIASNGDPSAEVLPSLIRFASAAFRRPADAEDVAPYLSLFENEVAGGASIEEALKTALAAILCAPDFLYLREEPGKLDDYALASRLSYFLTRSSPDSALLAKAAAGKFDLSKEALALLASTEFQRFVTDYTDGWLDLRNIDFTTPDAQLYPEFDTYLQESMVAETRAFFRELILGNHSVAKIVKPDFAMLNARLAAHYGIEGVTNAMVEKVALPESSRRGGFLGHASIHKVSANGTNTSPVLRGVWVNERILGKHPAPPPPGIPGVEPDIRGATTLREMLAKHRNQESCQGCHDLIDPPGFALESFDPVGAWRDNFRSLNLEDERSEALDVNGRRVRYRIGQPVDATGELPDGTTFDGFENYRDLLASDPDQLAKAFLTNILTFATGREMGFSDRPEINRLVRESVARGHGMRDIVLAAVISDIFRHK